MAHIIAKQLDVSPWEALLLAVRRAATWAAYYELKMGEAPEDDEGTALRSGGSHYEWVMAAERVNMQMARYAKMAIDAGVATMLVTQAKTEGATIAKIVNQALGIAGLDEEDERRVRAALRQALLAADNERVGLTIEGTTVE